MALEKGRFQPRGPSGSKPVPRKSGHHVTHGPWGRSMSRGVVLLALLTQGHAATVATSRFVLRSARDTDSRAIVSMVEPELIPAPGLSWWERCIADEGWCFVAEPRDDSGTIGASPIQGVVATRTCSAEFGLPERGHVSVCVVRAGSQGKGCGSMLLERACRVLHEKGFKCMSLFVRCSNERALQFYLRRHDFTIHRRVAGYYLAAGGLPVEDAFLLVRWGPARRDWTKRSPP